MQVLVLFPNKTKIVDFWSKNDQRMVSKNQGVCHVICIMFGITMSSFIIVGYMWQILSYPICEKPQESSSWIGLKFCLI